MDGRLYPAGSGSLFFAKYVDGVLKFFRRSDATEFYAIDGPNKRVLIPDTQRQLRSRQTIAAINAGATLLPAIPGYKYRMLDIKAIAVGGNVAAVTSVDVKGVQATSAVILALFAQASLTRSTVLRPGIAGTTVLADGASFASNDANTAITVIKAGSDITTATHVDFLLDYVIEVA
jgi:hypothetical protein